MVIAPNAMPEMIQSSRRLNPLLESYQRSGQVKNHGTVAQARCIDCLVPRNAHLDARSYSLVHAVLLRKVAGDLLTSVAAF